MDSGRQISRDSTDGALNVFQSKPSVFFSKKRVCVFLTGLLLLAIFGLLVGFLAHFMHSMPELCSKQPGQSGSLRDKVCLDCGLLQTKGSIDSGVTAPQQGMVFVERYEIKGGTMCCMEPVFGVQRLLELYPAEKQRVSIGGVVGCDPKGDQSEQDNGGNSNPRSAATAAHMFLNLDSLWDAAPGFEWTVGNDDAGFRTPDIDYRPGGGYGGRLVIPRDGIYYVYSSFRFDSYYNETLQRRSQSDAIVSHSIRRNSMGAFNEMLQFGIIQILPGTLKESYLSGNLKLKEGDELFIYISDYALIYYSQMSNVFGLYEV